MINQVCTQKTQYYQLSEKYNSKVQWDSNLLELEWLYKKHKSQKNTGNDTEEGELLHTVAKTVT